MAGPTCQQTKAVVNGAGGLLSVELYPPTREHLNVQALARLDAQMSQKLLAQGHLSFAGDRQRCCSQASPPMHTTIVRQSSITGAMAPRDSDGRHPQHSSSRS